MKMIKTFVLLFAFSAAMSASAADLQPKQGGTGVNNLASTLTLGGLLTTTGASTPTLAFPASGTPTYTFPSASSTLMTTAGGTFTGATGFNATSLPSVTAGVLGTAGGSTSTPALGANDEGDIFLNSINGLVHIGKGSTYDVTLLDSAGNIALGVQTGTLNLTFGGGVTAASLATPSSNIAGSLCATSGGVFLYNVGANCYTGGGTAGGSNTQVQYNASGSLGGIGGITSNGTSMTFATSDLIINGGTATAGLATVTSGGVMSSEANATVAQGGTNCTVASITCFNNITGFTTSGTTGTTSTNLVFSTNASMTSLSSAGLTVTSSFTATGLVTLADLASQSANTVLGATSAGSPAALSMPSCSGSAAIIWTTSVGFGCNTNLPVGYLACTNSSTDWASVISPALTSYGTVRIQSGVICQIASTQSIAAGKEIYVDAGGEITVNSGYTLTINGTFHAPVTKVLYGSGAVTGIGEVWPEWWGAVGNGSTNDAAAIQAAENSMEAASNVSDGNRVLHLRPVGYLVSSTISVTPQSTTKIAWRGNGAGGVSNASPSNSRLIGSTSGSGAVLQLFGSGAGTATDFDLEGFSVTPQTAGSGFTIGIELGSSATSRLVGGYNPATIRDVHVQDFARDWLVQDARMINFQSVSGWCQSATIGASCVPLVIDNSASSSSFTGDLTFTGASQFVAYQSASAYALEIVSGQSGASVSGVRFIGSTFYYGIMQLLAQTSGEVYDVWFTAGTQVDAIVGPGFQIGASGSATMVDIHINDAYIYGSGSDANPLLDIYSSSGTTEGIFVNGTMFYGTFGSDVIAINAASEVNFTGNKFFNTSYTGNELIKTASSTGVLIDGNQMLGSSVASYFITIASGQDYFVVRNNLASGLATTTVNNASSGATHMTVDGNW